MIVRHRLILVYGCIVTPPVFFLVFLKTFPKSSQKLPKYKLTPPKNGFGNFQKISKNTDTTAFFDSNPFFQKYILETSLCSGVNPFCKKILPLF